MYDGTSLCVRVVVASTVRPGMPCGVCVCVWEEKKKSSGGKVEEED